MHATKVILYKRVLLERPLAIYMEAVKSFILMYVRPMDLIHFPVKDGQLANLINCTAIQCD